MALARRSSLLAAEPDGQVLSMACKLQPERMRDASGAGKNSLNIEAEAVWIQA